MLLWPTHTGQDKALPVGSCWCDLTGKKCANNVPDAFKIGASVEKILGGKIKAYSDALRENAWWKEKLDERMTNKKSREQKNIDWLNTLEECMEFYKKNNRRPRQTIKNPTTALEKQEKRLGQWIGNQKKNYKNNKKGMSDKTEAGQGRREIFEKKILPLL